MALVWEKWEENAVQGLKKLRWTLSESSAFSLCDNAGVEMETTLEGRDFFHLQQYLPFSSLPLLQSKAQGPGAAGRREMPWVFSEVGKMLLQAYRSFPRPKP